MKIRCIDPRQKILIVSYTNPAAPEMSLRLVEKLRPWSVLCNTILNLQPPRDKHHFINIDERSFIGSCIMDAPVDSVVMSLENKRPKKSMTVYIPSPSATIVPPMITFSSMEQIIKHAEWLEDEYIKQTGLYPKVWILHTNQGLNGCKDNNKIMAGIVACDGTCQYSGE